MTRRQLLVVAAAVTAIGLGGWYGWRAYTAPVPPDLALVAMEPPVAAAVTKVLDDVRRSPRSAAAWGQLGMVLQANGYEDPALECFAHAERFDPDDARWPYLQVTRVQSEDRVRAVDLLRRAAARARTPDRRAAALFRLAQAGIEDGRADEAEADLRALAEIDPADLRVRLCEGLLAVLRDDPGTARERLAGLTDSVFARKRACSVLAALPAAHPEERRAYRVRAAELPTDEPWPDPFAREVSRLDVRRSARLAEVKELMDAGRHAEALEELNDLAARSPDASVYQGIGLTYMNLHRLDEAEAALAKAVEMDPRAPQAQAMFATVLIDRGETEARGPDGQSAARDRFRRALEAADRALATDRSYPVGHLARGRALRGLGRTEEALEALRQGVRCGPEYVDTHLHLGVSLAESGLRTEAIDEWKDAVRLSSPNDSRAQALLDKWMKVPLPKK